EFRRVLFRSNIVNGINGVVKEHRITDIILGLHQNAGTGDSFLGHTAESILSRCDTTTLIYRSIQPLATIKRHIVIIPENAEKEPGFPLWLLKVWNIARNTGAMINFYGSAQTLNVIKDVYKKNPIEAAFHLFTDWNDFLILSRDIKKDDNIIVALSRKEYISQNKNMSKVPVYLKKYFNENNFMLIYPLQSGASNSAIDYNNPSVLQPMQGNLEKLEDLGKTINNLFKRK